MKCSSYHTFNEDRYLIRVEPGDTVIAAHRRGLLPGEPDGVTLVCSPRGEVGVIRDARIVLTQHHLAELERAVALLRRQRDEAQSTSQRGAA